MVIIIEKRGISLCFFPKNINTPFERYWLEIDDKGKKQCIDVTDEMCYNNWYSFLIDFSKYSDGEYTYKLYGDGELIGYGIIQIGEYKLEDKNYKVKRQIKEYNG